MTENSQDRIEELRNLVKEMQDYGEFETSEQRVVCAACRWPDGHIILGIRHYSPDMRLSIALQGYNPVEQGIEQGFVDQRGRFLTRQEAYEIAERQGQYKPYPPFTRGTLYSEDLY